MTLYRRSFNSDISLIQRFPWGIFINTSVQPVEFSNLIFLHNYLLFYWYWVFFPPTITQNLTFLSLSSFVHGFPKNILHCTNKVSARTFLLSTDDNSCAVQCKILSGNPCTNPFLSKFVSEILYKCALVLCTGAEAGVLTYFAGAEVCSPPVKL